MNNIATICFKPCIPFPVQSPKTSFRKFPLTIPRSSLQDSQPPNSTQQQQQQLNLSVLRFTLGIPGLDESYLPRWIGYGFGSLLLLNHFLGSDAAAVTPAQLSTEVLGLSLASFSIVLPYLGKFLKGAQPVDEKTIPEGTEQIFVMSTEVGNGLKEDLAWASYVLLRNTNAIAMFNSVYNSSGGFILLASTTRYAFSNKDKAWIAAVANKFRGRVV